MTPRAVNAFTVLPLWNTTPRDTKCIGGLPKLGVAPHSNLINLGKFTGSSFTTKALFLYKNSKSLQ